MSGTGCAHDIGPHPKTGRCFGCGEQLQPPARPPLPVEVVDLLAVTAEALSMNGQDDYPSREAWLDALSRRAIVVEVWFDTIAGGARIDADYPDCAPGWLAHVERAAEKIRGLLAGPAT